MYLSDVLVDRWAAGYRRLAPGEGVGCTQAVWGAASTLLTTTQEDEEEPKEGPKEGGGPQRPGRESERQLSVSECVLPHSVTCLPLEDCLGSIVIQVCLFLPKLISRGNLLLGPSVENGTHLPLV